MKEGKRGCKRKGGGKKGRKGGRRGVVWAELVMV
jgi:hypothetical protein